MICTAADSDEVVARFKTNANDTGVVRALFQDANGENYFQFAYNAATDTFSLSGIQDETGQAGYTYDRANSVFTFNSGTAVDVDRELNTAMVSYDINTVALAGDDTAVSIVDRSVLQLTSNDGTPANRTFTLTGAVSGQRIIILWNDSDAGQLVDTSGYVLVGNWEPTNTGETITLFYDGSNFIELSRTDPT